MSGIAGWADFGGNERKESVLNGMLSALRHRGRDQEGVFEDKIITLMQSRLVIKDAEGGKQPMTVQTHRETYTIACDGRLFNAQEIKNRLEELGHAFSGYSDAEVALRAFIEWGEECLQKLNGVFAFAVWQHKKKKLFLCRDRIGVKPLFFYRYREGIVFASGIKVLMKNPLVKAEIDQTGLKQIMLLGPARIPGSGIIKDVRELKGGEYLYCDKENLYIVNYWRVQACRHSDDKEQTLEKVKYLVTDAVERQLTGDCAIACFLSGGLDSSIISYIAAKKSSALGKMLSTYSISYKDSDKYFRQNAYQPSSDDYFIKIMSAYIGSAHYNVELEDKEVADAVLTAALARDLPGMGDIDSALLLSCQKIKSAHCVILSGECADELFGGYPWYYKDDMLFRDTFPWSNSLEFRKALFKKEFIGQDADEFVKAQYESALALTDYLDEDDDREKRIREMFTLNFYWFMQTLLERNDRMSMFCGVESRTPFCDYRLVEYAYNMPYRLKFFKGREKGILREAFKNSLPQEIIERKKSPFPKTFNPLYARLIKQKLKEALADSSSALNAIVNGEYLRQLLDCDADLREPWFGQLMKLPQVYAYLLQIDMFFKTFSLKLS
ncbi:MAG: asparagine synthase (glutamine-hydrolyzing) [Christensenellales bacterium]|jgi:asparagine synthase (glutamine-hydrolysing)|nr:asparagine synthase (glutamine-hydrolyzing) [Clostridiales bacterium]